MLAGSLNNRQKCRKLVFMWVSGICFIEWLYFGSISILSTREWATLIWGLLFLVYIMCHKEIRKSFWKVIVIFFDKKLRILWEIILLYVLAITMIFYRSSIWENIYIKDIIIWFLFSGLIYCMNAVSR